MKAKLTTLSPVEYGLACGILWGVATLVMGITGAFTTIKLPLAHLTDNFYGHPIGVLQGFLAGVRAFIDGFLAGGLIAILYNALINQDIKKK